MTLRHGCECTCPSTSYPCVFHDTTEEMREAYYLLMAMHAAQRGRVLCWFCDACREYIGPGTSHVCSSS